uniref:(California timema) hypothetical protein n=1 Tax=Timema californicum TaxID=61474 RepID=A0A7R9J332_TIMCA|nr:unnamed protein product [Timema californicum]
MFDETVLVGCNLPLTIRSTTHTYNERKELYFGFSVRPFAGFPGYSFFPPPTVPGGTPGIAPPTSDRANTYYDYTAAVAQQPGGTMLRSSEQMGNHSPLHRDHVAATYHQQQQQQQHSRHPVTQLDLTNGQLTPNNNTPLLTQALSDSLKGVTLAIDWTVNDRGSNTSWLYRGWFFTHGSLIFFHIGHSARWTPPPPPQQPPPPPPPQRHFSVSFAVMNNYQAAAAAAAQGFGPPASPHTANTRGAFPPANSPGPMDMYSSGAGDSVAGYVQAASPQPSGFPAIAVSRAPISYNPDNFKLYFPFTLIPSVSSFDLCYQLYSSPMASLVLTDSSKLTSDGFGKLPDKIMYPYAEPYDLQKHVFSSCLDHHGYRCGGKRQALWHRLNPPVLLPKMSVAVV